jgi:multidrug efflux system membrane fusion protein
MLVIHSLIFGNARRASVAAVIASALIGAVVLPSCGRKAQQSRPPVPVEAAKVMQKTVPLELRAIGTIEAYSTVDVKSQIGGVLSKVHFREGQDVKKGDRLFTIDPRPFEAALRQAEANLARDKAQLANAKVEAKRYADLVEKGYVAQQQNDQMRTAAEALEATVQADQAAVETARLQLGYCFIHAPVSGRTGNLIAYEGNVIKANADTAMVVIHQIQPVYATFSVPENALPLVSTYMQKAKLVVEAAAAGDEQKPAKGVLTFVNNAVNTSTGTIELKATFPNSDRRLWPGQFVNVVLTLAAQKDAVVVPSAAVQEGQQGKYVFVIKPDMTAESRPVVVGLSAGGETVIASGLQPDETVVTDGQLRLVPGAKVEVKNEQGKRETKADAGNHGGTETRSNAEQSSKSQTSNPK